MDALLTLDVAVGGPRGEGVAGPDGVRDWLARTGITMEPVAAWRHGDAVVVEQRARWRDAATGAPGKPQTVFTAFQIRAGRISRILRFDSLTDALRASGLSEDDRDPSWSN